MTLNKSTNIYHDINHACVYISLVPVLLIPQFTGACVSKTILLSVWSSKISSSQSTHLCIYDVKCQHKLCAGACNQPIDQPINQWANPSVHQPINQPINQLKPKVVRALCSASFCTHSHALTSLVSPIYRHLLIYFSWVARVVMPLPFISNDTSPRTTTKKFLHCKPLLPQRQ